jgi:DNA-binding Xre family transcriptional regulator
LAKKTTYQELMEGLKKVLKDRSLTYKKVAEYLQISEASVKRIFTAEDGSLGRIQQLCEWLEIKFEDLVVLSLEDDTDETYVLSQKQENYFLKNPGALQVFVELYEYGQTPKGIRDHYNLTKKSMTKYLLDLERIGLLEVFPGDKIKFKFNGFFTVSDKGRLAKIILRNSMESATEYVIKTLGERKKDPSIVSTFTIGELLFTKETVRELIKDYNALTKKLYSTSSREMRLYPKNELVPFQYQLGLIPERMMKEKIQNL